MIDRCEQDKERVDSLEKQVGECLQMQMTKHSLDLKQLHFKLETQFKKMLKAELGLRLNVLVEELDSKLTKLDE